MRCVLPLLASLTLLGCSTPPVKHRAPPLPTKAQRLDFRTLPTRPATVYCAELIGWAFAEEWAEVMEEDNW